MTHEQDRPAADATGATPAIDYVSLSKAMSKALRHRPERLGIKLARDGSVSIGVLLRALNRRGGWPRTLTEADLMQVVEHGTKQRFAVESGRIRARYGHSIELDAAYILPDGEGLLDGTPLRDLQYYPLLDERTIRGFVREVEDSDIEVLIRNDDIHSFIRRIRALYLMTTDIFNESASDRAVSEACSSWAVPTVG